MIYGNFGSLRHGTIAAHNPCTAKGHLKLPCFSLARILSTRGSLGVQGGFPEGWRAVLRIAEVGGRREIIAIRPDSGRFGYGSPGLFIRARSDPISRVRRAGPILRLHECGHYKRPMNDCGQSPVPVIDVWKDGVCCLSGSRSLHWRRCGRYDVRVPFCPL